MENEKDDDHYECNIRLWLDGYENKEEHDKACAEFIYDQLDMTASSVKISTEPTIKASELKSFIEEQKQYLCECVNSGDLMREDLDLPFQVLNKVLREFCKGESHGR
jgi:hypothetical protein